MGPAQSLEGKSGAALRLRYGLLLPSCTLGAGKDERPLPLLLSDPSSSPSLSYDTTSEMYLISAQIHPLCGSGLKDRLHQDLWGPFSSSLRLQEPATGWTRSFRVRRGSDAHHPWYLAPTEEPDFGNCNQDIATKMLTILSYAHLCPGNRNMIGYLDLTGLDTVNSESLNIIINFQTSGRAKCLFVADLGLFHKMGFRPRLSELYGRLHIRFSKAILSVGAIGSQGYQDG